MYLIYHVIPVINSMMRVRIDDSDDDDSADDDSVDDDNDIILKILS